MGDMQTMAPLLGASGAISAVMGAFLIRHHKTRIKFVYFLGFAGKFQIPALLFLPFWLAEQFFFATTDTIGSGVAFWAHIGGFIYGMIFALLIKLFQVERLYINPQQGEVGEGDVWKKDETPVKETLDSNVSIARELMAKEKYGDAIISLNAALSAYPSNLDTLKLLYFAYLKTGQMKNAIEIAGRMCERLIHEDRKEDAAEVYREIKKAEPTALFPLRIQYNLARALSDLSMFSDSARAYYEFAVAYPDNALASKTLFTAAQIILTKLQSPQNAYKILVYLNHKYPNHPNLEAANEMISRITGGAAT
jgi:tetratricopeptide (TPR) repeat protein